MPDVGGILGPLYALATVLVIALLFYALIVLIARFPAPRPTG